MKKDFYVSPSVKVKAVRYEYSLLASGTEFSSSSSLEGFEDNGESIVW